MTELHQQQLTLQLSEGIVFGIMIVLFIAVMVLLIAFVLMVTSKQRRHRFWARFAKIRHQRTILQTDSYHDRTKVSVPNDDNMESFQSLVVQHDLANQEQLRLVAQEIKDWKGIQSEVRCQLLALDKAVQLMKHSSNQNRLPSLTKLD
jgi:hypothetical protein